MSKNKTAAEKRAELIIKYRHLKVEKKEKEDGMIVYYLVKDDKRYIMNCLLEQDTIGIAFVRELKQLVDKEGADKGILVGKGKYTYSAKSTSPRLNVELIPSNLPVFDIFEHKLVPRAEIVSEADKVQLIERYHAQPYQFPWLKASDPLAIILGAEPGDVLRLLTKSETAGESESYRYVV